MGRICEITTRKAIEIMVKVSLSYGLISLMILVHLSGHSLDPAQNATKVFHWTNLALNATKEFSVFDPKTVAYGFCHTDDDHLIGNLVAFILALPALVDLQPIWVILTTFPFCCWTGSLAHVYENWSKIQNGSIIQLCGASGGIHGLLTVTALSFSKTDSFPYKVWLLSVYPFLMGIGNLTSLDGDVSQAAHIGGIFGGLVITCLTKVEDFLCKNESLQHPVDEKDALQSYYNNDV